VEHRSLRPAPSVVTTSRFELAPPRRFILPAILLLLSEEPGYGYSLALKLEEFRLGHVDRPAVYRGLAQLEADGLVESTSDDRGARQARRVYHLTALGQRALRAWMGIVKEEHDQLGRVLRRYQATGTADAVLAQVAGGWGASVGYGWSPVSPTYSGLRRLATIDTPGAGAVTDSDVADGSGREGVAQAGRYELVPDRSVVLIEVRSTAGPLSFGTVGVTGYMQAVVSDGVVQAKPPPEARIEVDVTGLRSGNRLYDGELLRRIDARRFPTASVTLDACEHPMADSLYRLRGELTLHGVTRGVAGTVCVEALTDERLLITGEQMFDIRDFAIPSPTVLMLRIYPDVRVRLHAEAEFQEEV
jgi:DNA-binding PadR family transcriptional regulator/polyisoprenoid-binding protein YceI